MLGAALIGCGGRHGGALDAAAPPPDLAHSYLPVTSAQRCEECHGRMAEEWKGSAHARADRGALYLAMREKAPEPEACERCHAPWHGQADPAEPGAHEAINCDVCHTIREVDVKKSGSSFTLRTREATKYGPLCDAKDHYFHKMGCSPLHERAEFCAACHLLYRTVGTTSLPVFTEYEEWKNGPYADAGMDCQHCHMPSTAGEVARGAKARVAVPNHGFLGKDGGLRRRAVNAKISVRELPGGTLEVTAIVTNHGAGHRVPSGLPERRLLLRARALDEDGATQAELERAYGRVLTDEAGHERPFYAATREAQDSRLAPLEKRVEVLTLAAPKAGRLVVEILWRDASTEIAHQLGIRPTDELLGQAELRFGAAPKTGRRRLPEPVLVGEP